MIFSRAATTSTNSRTLTFPVRLIYGKKGEIVTMTMIMMGVGMIAMAAVFTSILTIYKMKKSDNLTAQQKDTVKQLENLMSLPAVCNALFNGKNISTSISNPNNKAMATNLATATTAVKLNGVTVNLNPGTNPEIAPGLILSGIKYYQKSNVSTTVKVAGVDRDGQDGAMILSLKKKDSENLFQDYKEVEFNMQVATDPSGVIVSCASLAEEGQACESLNGIWRPLAPLGLRCQFKNTCLTGGSYVNAPQSEGGFGNPLAGNAMACPVGYTAKNKGNVAYPYRTGKYDVNNRIYDVIECIACIDNTGVRLSPSSTPSPTTYNADFNTVDEAAGRWLDQNGGFYGL